MVQPGSTNSKLLYFALVSLILFYSSCTQDEVKEKPPITQTTTTKPGVEVPVFNEDSAYLYVKKQVDFGPRVPSTSAHDSCAAYLVKTFERFAIPVQVQTATLNTYDGKAHELKNIIATYKPESKERILLCAHWDSRHIADRGTERTDKPIDGANDGASGVGVLIEVARQVSLKEPNVGVDFILFDLEDYGQPDNSTYPTRFDTWCLGSQYWAKNPHKPGYYARYGILLDMVGASDAVFGKEGTSMNYAAATVEKVWRHAANLGYASYFIQSSTGPITDDHLYINRIAAIPTIDIVHIDPRTDDFGPFHHTHNDNIEVIDKQTLKVVGQTLVSVLYSE